MNKIVLFIILFLLLTTAYFWIKIKPKFGSTPKDSFYKKISLSPNFSTKKNSFINQQEQLVAEAHKNTNTWKIAKEFFFSQNEVRPKEKLPDIVPNLDDFIKPSDTVKLIWLGHSSFLLRLNNKTILVDPVFSPSAAPLDFITTRFQAPVLSLEELPKIDAIIISHDHYDHLDSRTIQFFRGSAVKFYVPLGVGSHLREWGIKNQFITELDWWESSQLSATEFICTPAQHFSGRTKPHENKTLWASWVFKTNKHKIYFSGDSGYGPHFKKIGDKYGPFDLTLLENGQYNEEWKPVHMHPEETAKAYKDLKSKSLIAVHWGMFNMAVHNWYDPIEAIEKIAKEKNLVLLTPQIGELFVLGQKKKLKPWWKALIKKTL